MASFTLCETIVIHLKETIGSRYKNRLCKYIHNNIALKEKNGNNVNVHQWGGIALSKQGCFHITAVDSYL